MYRNRISTTGLVLVSALLCAQITYLPLATASEKFNMTISVGAPLYFADGNGFFDEIAAEIFKRLDMDYEMTWLPPQRSLVATDQGAYDGHIARTAAIESRFPNLIRVPVNIFDFEFMAFSRLPDLQISGWPSLLPYRVGMLRGWKIVEQNTLGAKSVIQVNEYDQLLTLLDKQRVDVAILDRVMGGWKLQQLGYDINIIEPAIVTKPNFIYLHKKHQELVPTITRVVKEMKRDGTYDAIYTRTLAEIR